jgi:hypothetical protein
LTTVPPFRTRSNVALMAATRGLPPARDPHT